MTDPIDDLERLAKEATPNSSWTASPNPHWSLDFSTHNGSVARYIAAASPDTILSLIERVKRAEEKYDLLNKLLAEYEKQGYAVPTTQEEG